jgi:hypothetical protein
MGVDTSGSGLPVYPLSGVETAQRVERGVLGLAAEGPGASCPERIRTGPLAGKAGLNIFVVPSLMVHFVNDTDARGTRYMSDIPAWMSRSRLLLLLFGLLSATPSIAEKKTDTSETVSELKRLYEDGKYTTGLKRAESALSSTRLDKRDRVTLLLFQGIFSYYEEKEQAGAAFTKAFTDSPDERLPVEVSPKVKEFADSFRPKPVPFNPRTHARIPAVAGGALSVAGGIFVGVSRNDANRLRTNDPRIQSRADVDVLVARGQTRQTLGYSLLGVGVAGLVTATGMYLWGKPPSAEGVSLGVGTDGTSAFVYGRWP